MNSKTSGKMMMMSDSVRDVVEALANGRGFWINEDDFAEWYEDIAGCPHADKEAIYITWDGENELTIEV